MVDFTNCSILSFLHTLISAIADFFRSVTIADIVNGFRRILRTIFVQLPIILWNGLEALAHGIHATLVNFFGILYWIVYCILYVLGFLVTYVPAKIGRIIGYVGGGIAQELRELWVWISPKSMA